MNEWGVFGVEQFFRRIPFVCVFRSNNNLEVRFKFLWLLTADTIFFLLFFFGPLTFIMSEMSYLRSLCTCIKSDLFLCFHSIIFFCRQHRHRLYVVANYPLWLTPEVKRKKRWSHSNVPDANSHLTSLAGPYIQDSIAYIRRKLIWMSFEPVWLSIQKNGSVFIENITGNCKTIGSPGMNEFVLYVLTNHSNCLCCVVNHSFHVYWIHTFSAE